MKIQIVHKTDPGDGTVFRTRTSLEERGMKVIEVRSDLMDSSELDPIPYIGEGGKIEFTKPTLERITEGYNAVIIDEFDLFVKRLSDFRSKYMEMIRELAVAGKEVYVITYGDAGKLAAEFAGQHPTNDTNKNTSEQEKSLIAMFHRYFEGCNSEWEVYIKSGKLLQQIRQMFSPLGNEVCKLIRSLSSEIIPDKFEMRTIGQTVMAFKHDERKLTFIHLPLHTKDFTVYRDNAYIIPDENTLVFFDDLTVYDGGIDPAWVFRDTAARLRQHITTEEDWGSAYLIHGDPKNLDYLRGKFGDIKILSEVLANS